MSNKNVFTSAVVEELRELLEKPPVAPRPTTIRGVRALVVALTPQIKTLTKAGYSIEQIADFFAQKHVTVTPSALARALRTASPVARRAKKQVAPIDNEMGV